jgi:hypothetical protein
MAVRRRTGRRRSLSAFDALAGDPHYQIARVHQWISVEPRPSRFDDTAVEELNLNLRLELE